MGYVNLVSGVLFGIYYNYGIVINKNWDTQLLPIVEYIWTFTVT